MSDKKEVFGGKLVIPGIGHLDMPAGEPLPPGAKVPPTKKAELPKTKKPDDQKPKK